LRNWSTNKFCHRCQKPKAEVFLRCFEPAGGDAAVAPKSKGSELERLKAQVDKEAKAKRALEAELKKVRGELSSAKGGGSSDAASEEPAGMASAEIDLLREHIKVLSGIPGAEGLVATKQAQLDKLVHARSEAKPVGVRIKNLEGVLDRKRKVRERLDVERGDLQKKLAAAQEKVTENVKAIQTVDDEIKGLEAQRAALYQARVEEASAAARLSTGTSPEVGGNALAAFLGGLPSEILLQAGTTKEQVDGVLGKLSVLLELGRRHVGEAAAASGAAVAEAPLASVPTALVPGAAPVRADADGDLGMDDDPIEDWLGEEPASPEEQATLRKVKAKMLERGIYLKYKHPKKLVRKEL
jgi:hypothetical protein